MLQAQERTVTLETGIRHHADADAWAQALIGSQTDQGKIVRITEAWIEPQTFRAGVTADVDEAQTGDVPAPLSIDAARNVQLYRDYPWARTEATITKIVYCNRKAQGAPELELAELYDRAAYDPHYPNPHR
jgi:hypothetical protein